MTAETAPARGPSAWLALCRPRLLPSAACDVLCGAALAGGLGLAGTPALLRVLATSLLLYAGGMVWNDVADAKRDAKRFPDRPIPSGRVPRLLAALFGTALLAAAWLLAPAAPHGPLVLGMVAGVLLYDLVGSRVLVLGAPLLGLLRGANVALGYLILGDPSLLLPWLAVAAYALYVALVVLHGHEEDAEAPLAEKSSLLLLTTAFLPFVPAPFLPWGWLAAVAAAPQLLLTLDALRRTFDGRASVEARTGLMLRGLSRFTAALALGTGQWLLAGLCLALAWIVPPLLRRARWT
ncbi:MAG: UbiA family prenyltransferase [Planctomycetota bacterium]